MNVGAHVSRAGQTRLRCGDEFATSHGSVRLIVLASLRGRARTSLSGSKGVGERRGPSSAKKAPQTPTGRPRQGDRQVPQKIPVFQARTCLSGCLPPKGGQTSRQLRLPCLSRQHQTALRQPDRCIQFTVSRSHCFCPLAPFSTFSGVIGSSLKLGSHRQAIGEHPSSCRATR